MERLETEGFGDVAAEGTSRDARAEEEGVADAVRRRLDGSRGVAIVDIVSVYEAVFTGLGVVTELAREFRGLWSDGIRC